MSTGSAPGSARRFRLHHCVGVAVSHLPFPLFAAVHLGYAEGICPRFSVHRGTRVLVANGVGHVPEHVGRDDFVRVRRAIREGAFQLAEDVPHLLGSAAGHPSAQDGDRLPVRPDRKPRTGIPLCNAISASLSREPTHVMKSSRSLTADLQGIVFVGTRGDREKPPAPRTSHSKTPSAAGFQPSYQRMRTLSPRLRRAEVPFTGACDQRFLDGLERACDAENGHEARVIGRRRNSCKCEPFSFRMEACILPLSVPSMSCAASMPAKCWPLPILRPCSSCMTCWTTASSSAASSASAAVDRKETRLEHGCLSCTVRLDVVPTVERLLARGEDHIIIALPPAVPAAAAVSALKQGLASQFTVDVCGAGVRTGFPRGPYLGPPHPV